MKLKHWIRFLLYRDSTRHGQFSTLGPLLLGRKGFERTVVDVGANDGFYSSNSYPFIARGWQALLIEPHPTAFQKAKQLYRNRKQVSLLNVACSGREGELELHTCAADDGGSHSFIGKLPATKTILFVRQVARFTSKSIGWKRSWTTLAFRTSSVC